MMASIPKIRGKRELYEPFPRGEMNMPTKLLTLGYSPCPNDTFIFHALSQGRIDTSPYRFDVTLEDVDALNRKARVGALDVSKVSANAVSRILDHYWLLRSGGALGRGCGPLVVARQKLSPEQLRAGRMAIPGRLTTAYLLLRLNGMHEGPVLEMPFDRIMPAVAAGEAEAGRIIHEGRFTYGSHGLTAVLDLGEWWEARTGLPLPLGVIAIKRSLGAQTAGDVESIIRQSLLHARSNPDEARPYICEHAQEMEPSVIERHIETFVNDFSISMGKEGEESVRYLLRESCRIEGIPFPSRPIFWE